MESGFRFKNWCLKIAQIRHYHADFWRKFPQIPGHDFEKPISSRHGSIKKRHTQFCLYPFLQIEKRIGQ